MKGNAFPPFFLSNKPRPCAGFCLRSNLIKITNRNLKHFLWDPACQNKGFTLYSNDSFVPELVKGSQLGLLPTVILVSKSALRKQTSINKKSGRLSPQDGNQAGKLCKRRKEKHNAQAYVEAPSNPEVPDGAYLFPKGISPSCLTNKHFHLMVPWLFLTIQGEVLISLLEKL